MSTRTRGKKKAEAASEVVASEPSAPQQQTAQLDARIAHIADRLGTMEEKHAATTAELRQAMLEMKFEQQQLRDKYAKLLASQKEQRDALHEQQMENVATKSSVATLERHLDRFLAVLRARPEASAAAEPDDAPTGKHQHVDTDVGSDVGSDVSFAAESRVSALSELHSEASAASRSTGYVQNSSVEAMRRALKLSRCPVEPAWS